MLSLEFAYTANLEKIQKFLKIVLGVLDMQDDNNLKGNKILSRKFDDEHISYDEVLAMCNKINKEEGRGTIEVLNESFEFKQIKNGPGSEKFQEIFKELNRMECKDLGMEFIPFTKKDIKENIIFKIKNVDKLKELDQEIDKAILGSDHQKTKIEVKKDQQLSPKAEYANGVLFFCGKKFDFDRKENQKDLLTTLFKDSSKDWFYDEIQEDWDESWEGIKKYNPEVQKYWRKFYNAGDDINNCIAIDTGIKDFIVKNTGTRGRIRINEKYVS